MDAGQRIGLTLSGGGFRATLFHLGVVRLLHDTGLLTSVKRIGAVSGGSIFAAHLVLNWNRYTAGQDEFESAAKELIDFVRTDIRGRVVRRWILAWLTILPRLVKRKHWTFTNLLQRMYADLYKNATLNDLHPTTDVHRPQVFFFCTSLSTGAVCSFGRSGFMWDEEDLERSVVAPMLPVAFAVAASSAFPPLFPPIAITHDTLSCDLKEFRNPHYLTDGGVYDNLGVDRLIWYHKQANDLDKLIVSDAEGNFDWDFNRQYTFITSRNIRASDVMMKRVSSLQYNNLGTYRDSLLVRIGVDTVIQKPDDPAVFSPEIQKNLRNVRTDLDAFSLTEVNCLVGHGYAVARQCLIERKLISDLTPNLGWTPIKTTKLAKQSELNHIREARRRKLLLWSNQDWVSWASLALVLSIAALLVRPIFAKKNELEKKVAAGSEKFQSLAKGIEPINTISEIVNERRAKYGSAPQGLWVDDNPDNNINERTALENAGLHFKLALSTSEAKVALKSGKFDVIISDLDREGEPRAGYVLLKYIKNEMKESPPFIIYSSSKDFSRTEAQGYGAFVGETTGLYDLFVLIAQALKKTP